MEIEDDSGVQDLQTRTSLPSRSGKSTMVGLDKELIEILTWMDGDSLALKTLSIVGMAGIGKTTFARKIYDHQRIQEICHVRAWVTVSQNYDERKIILDLLDSMKKLSGEMHKLETSALKEKLYKNLIGRRYLIVMDDIWDTKVWNDVNRLFPDNKERSRIILTTRLKSVAVHVNSSRSALHQMRFLNEVESWNLFCEKVFGGDCCPGELNQIGSEIAKKCGGLPLAIVLIGGLLSKSIQTQSYWENVAKNLTSVITSHDDQSSKILYLSYNNLPHHLRVCFLYMGIFPEDYEILASKLVKLWIAEGFIEPVMTSKSLEDVAEEYLLNLVGRSLISVSKRSSRGKIKKCKIHDLLHEFCVREAKKESFFHVTDRSLRDVPTEIITSHITSQILTEKIVSLRRVSIHPNTQTNLRHADSLPTSTVRTVLNFDPTLSLSVEFLNSSLLRVLDTVNANSFDFPTETVELLNLRYLACLSGTRELPSSMYKLRNLQTLILSCMESSFCLPSEIWKMPQLRHVHLDSVILPDPPVAGVKGEKSLIVLQDLQSLSTVINFKFVEDILRRILNLKKLGILYDDIREDRSDYLNNLVLLKNLAALKCIFRWPYQTFLKKIIFPPSLNKLTLRGCFLPWEDMTIVGSLPKLQVLKLKRKAFSGAVWEPKEGEFLQLKFLLLEENNLEDWNAERTHFPMLEHLILHNCQRLKEVPCGIGEILTLQKIELYYCSDSLVTSANEIREEQYNSGNEDFQVRIVEMTAEEFENC